MEQLQQDALERERQEDRSIADHKVDMDHGEPHSVLFTDTVSSLVD